MNYLHQYEVNTFNLIKKDYQNNPAKYPDITTYIKTFNDYGIGSKEYILNKAITLAKDLEIKGRAKVYEELNMPANIAKSLLQ